MAITPTSTKSKQYQALGIDEIATDIETVFTAVSTLQDNPSTGYTETIVNISSAQILAMGTTPIELLPAAGANSYYDIDKVILEYTHVTTAYDDSLISYVILRNGSQYTSSVNSGFISNASNKGQRLSFIGLEVDYISLNSNLTLGTDNDLNPTLGNGTIRVKIYHKTITFGA